MRDRVSSKNAMLSAGIRHHSDRTGVAIRPIFAEETAAILRAILESSDQGVLLTDLDHRALACNRRFGEIFDIDPETVVRCEVDELRRRVEHLIPDTKKWVAMLERVYASPTEEYEDEQPLLKSPPIVVRRFTGPVLNKDGTFLGRLWTFLDISKDRRSQLMADALYEVSTFHDAVPATVYGHILQVISDFYGRSTALLSIKQGERMEYRCIKGPPSIIKRMKGVQLKDSYCRLVLRDFEPKLIQDTRKHPDTKRMLSSFVGFSRYLGVPIHDSNGTAIGTVCFLDSKSADPLNEEDVRFMSLLAMRIGAEVAREHYLQSRLSEQREVLDQQRSDLEATQEVLTAMNRAFSLIETNSSFETVVAEQTGLLPGLLGFHSSAILVPDGPSGNLKCFVSAKRGGKAQRTSMKCDECDVASEALRRFQHADNDETMVIQADAKLKSTMQSHWISLMPLRHEGELLGILALGSNQAPNANDRHRSTHIAALVDQISVLLATHLLHQQLIDAHNELRATQLRLVQSEKLSIVGTLAASVAHDIKNILASLSLELAAGDAEPEKAMVSVREQLDRFSVLAHRLLSYAKPRLVARQNINLSEILNRVIALTSPQLRVTKIRLSSAIADPLPSVLGDPHQLEHLFVNLIMNAVQSMSSGEGVLGLQAVRSGKFVVIEVKDSGKGIAKEAIEKLFEPFYSTRSEGFGLGLYSCKRIVEDHGGTIDVKSKLNQGTTFRITLPTEMETETS